MKCFSWSITWESSVSEQREKAAGKSRGTGIPGRVTLAGIFFVCLLAAQAAGADSGPAPGTQSSPVTRPEVWHAVVAKLHEQGFSEPQLPRIDDLELPAALPAGAGRKLRVASACWDRGPQRTQFRLECGEPGQCLPFLVYLHDDGKADRGARAASCREEAEARPALEGAAKPLPKPAVHAGDKAMVVFHSESVRITARVTCLDRGREGEMIRVRNQDGEIFRARISGPARLEAVPQ